MTRGEVDEKGGAQLRSTGLPFSYGSVSVPGIPVRRKKPKLISSRIYLFIYSFIPIFKGIACAPV
jgi:hypothetical protein